MLFLLVRGNALCNPNFSGSQTKIYAWILSFEGLLLVHLSNKPMARQYNLCVEVINVITLI